MVNSKICSYVSMMKNNLLYGLQIGIIARQYPIDISPTGITFSIWNVIYNRLGSFAITPTSQEITTLFNDSCTLNSAWLRSFSNKDFYTANQNIIDLKEKLELLTSKISNPYHLYTFDIYTTWVTGAAILQQGLLGKYGSNGTSTGVDNSYNNLITFLDSVSVSRTGQINTLDWLLSGIITNKNNNLSAEQRTEIINKATFTTRNLTVQKCLSKYVTIFQRY